MTSTLEKVKQILWHEYGLDVYEAYQMVAGVGGDTYKVETAQGDFIYKIADANEMNHPEAEPEICNYLYTKGVEVSVFMKNKRGAFITPCDNNRVSHLQQYIEGKVFSTNTVPEWFMLQSPVLLGKIHSELRGYKELPVGIGPDFFRYMTPESAKQSYFYSYENAKQKGETGILVGLEFRIQLMDKMPDWKFDLSKLTYCNTHGDYNVNQIICGKEKINAVIDWTCACQHPVIWEITRSFFLAEPTCVDGNFNETEFKKYVEGYCSVAPLTQYDKDNLLKIYYYQLAVCDYYSQYLNADIHKKEEYLSQAEFATKVLKELQYSI